MGGHIISPMCPRGRAHWRNLANTIEPSVYGGDAALCQITVTTLLLAAIACGSTNLSKKKSAFFAPPPLLLATLNLRNCKPIAAIFDSLDVKWTTHCDHAIICSELIGSRCRLPTMLYGTVSRNTGVPRISTTTPSSPFPPSPPLSSLSCSSHHNP